MSHCFILIVRQIVHARFIPYYITSVVYFLLSDLKSMTLLIFAVIIPEILRVVVLHVLRYYLAFLGPKQQLITVVVLMPLLLCYFAMIVFENVPWFIYFAPLFEWLYNLFGYVKSGADWYNSATLRVMEIILVVVVFSVCSGMFCLDLLFFRIWWVFDQLLQAIELFKHLVDLGLGSFSEDNLFLFFLRFRNAFFLNHLKNWSFKLFVRFFLP